MLYTHGLVQDCSVSIANALELPQSCARSSICTVYPKKFDTVFALLCFVVVIHWLIFPYPSGLLHWHCGNLTIAPVPAKQPWWIWINTSCEFIMNDCITTTKQQQNRVHISWDILYVPGYIKAKAVIMSILLSPSNSRGHSKCAFLFLYLCVALASPFTGIIQIEKRTSEFILSLILYSFLLPKVRRTNHMPCLICLFGILCQ